jgi:hypothetical protein
MQDIKNQLAIQEADRLVKSIEFAKEIDAIKARIEKQRSIKELFLFPSLLIGTIVLQIVYVFLIK